MDYPFIIACMGMSLTPQGNTTSITCVNTTVIEETKDSKGKIIKKPKCDYVATATLSVKDTIRLKDERYTETMFDIISRVKSKTVSLDDLKTYQKERMKNMSKDLDKITSGLQPSDLILVAARPSMGKTAFTLNIASHVAIREKKAVAFFSLEMSKEQLVQRMLCSEATIDSQRLRIGELEERDWTKLISAADRLSSAPIYIDDTPGITVMEMRSKARRLKIEHDLQLIIIDYLQLMQGSSNKGGDNRQQEISEISRSLKALARELNVPVIALSQLSRSVESRQIKKPMLSDLRESGSLEQDADIVSFLYREDYYNPETENKNITDIIIAKHRNGPVDTVQLFFHKQFTKFCDLSRVQE